MKPTPPLPCLTGVVPYRSIACTLCPEPGAYHLMLFDARRRLQPGGSLSLQRHLADGECIPVFAPVVRDTGVEDRHH